MFASSREDQFEFDFSRGVEDETQEICFQGELHQQDMDQDETLNLKLWYNHESSDFEARCYLWCTEDSELPHARPSSDVDQGILDELVDNIQCFPF